MPRYKNIEVKEFDITDVDKMSPREIDAEFISMIKAIDSKLLSPAITGWNKESPLFCAGIFINQFNRVGDLWLFCDKKISDHWIEMRRVLIDHLMDYHEKESIKRFQIIIKEENLTCIRLAESMGFVKEGCLKKYGSNNENCYIYGRVK